MSSLHQGFSNFWCYGAHNKVDHYLQTLTINFSNKNKKMYRYLLLSKLEVLYLTTRVYSLVLIKKYSNCGSIEVTCNIRSFSAFSRFLDLVFVAACSENIFSH